MKKFFSLLLIVSCTLLKTNSVSAAVVTYCPDKPLYVKPNGAKVEIKNVSALEDLVEYQGKNNMWMKVQVYGLKMKPTKVLWVKRTDFFCGQIVGH